MTTRHPPEYGVASGAPVAVPVAVYPRNAGGVAPGSSRAAPRENQRVPRRCDWLQYERVKRRLAARYGPGSEQFDEALEAFLERAGL